MPYFRANAHLIAQMVKKDCLRYSTDNLASIETFFVLPAKAGKSFYFAVVFLGDNAEIVSRIESDNLWYEIKGQLKDHSPKFDTFHLSNLCLFADSFIELPVASASLVQCDLIGRLTRDPEHVIKNDSFDFVRFSIAVNRKNPNLVNYFDVSVFKPKMIELVNQKAQKGQSVYVSGELTFFQKANDASVHAAIKLEQLIFLEKH